MRSHAALGRTPVLVCSADLYALRDLADELRSDRLVGILEKPFSIGQLESSVRRLLDDGGFAPAPRVESAQAAEPGPT